MPSTLTIRDETSTGDTIGELTLDVLTEHITVRELIRSRVYQEVDDHNRTLPERFNMLVQPEDAERTLNGLRMKKPRPIDFQKQYDKACEAFERNGFLLLVDDVQYDELDQPVTLKAQSDVTFLKLVPLVGG